MVSCKKKTMLSESFVNKGKEDKVYLPKKALYGMKQGPRTWYRELIIIWWFWGLQKVYLSLLSLSLYIKHNEVDILDVSLYVGHWK